MLEVLVERRVAGAARDAPTATLTTEDMAGRYSFEYGAAIGLEPMAAAGGSLV